MRAYIHLCAAIFLALVYGSAIACLCEICFFVFHVDESNEKVYRSMDVLNTRI